MELYSGRLDIISSKEQTKKDLVNFYKNYASNEEDFIVCYEEKTKAGLPCKPHVHFLFYSNKSHDGMRKTLSGLGYKGPLGSLTNVSKNKKYTKEKTYSYVLKQGDILATNLDSNEIEQLKESAKQINQQIQQKMETFSAHWQTQIVPYLLEKQLFERIKIYIYVHQYITEWNKDIPQEYPSDTPPNQMKIPIQYPSKATMLSLVQLFEGKYLEPSIACRRYLVDMGFSDTSVWTPVNDNFTEL